MDRGRMKSEEMTQIAANDDRVGVKASIKQRV